jgi:uncharacterized protein
MIYLLDVNVIIALMDPEHAHHGRALRFFPRVQKSGWATCPLVENAFIRIFGHPEYPCGPGSVDVARQLLCQYCATSGHQFWADDLSLRDSTRFPSLSGSKALTDLYLLALAVKKGERFASLDARINPALIPGGLSSYYLID